VSGVNPSSVAVSLAVTTPPSADPISWSSTLSESRTLPAPARTTSGRTPASTLTPSSSQILARNAVIVFCGTSRNG